MSVVWNFRKCARCQQTLPADAFRRNPRLKSGLHSHCRECAREVGRLWREENRDYIAAEKAKRKTPPTELVCSECGKTFYGRKDRLVCGQRKCKDTRYRRLHPEEYKARRKLKDARRRARARAARAHARLPGSAH